MMATCVGDGSGADEESGGGVVDAPVLSLRTPEQVVVDRELGQVAARQVVEAVPWRAPRSARGQGHFPGFYWSATTGRHVAYESRLELARVLLADFDPEVVAIAAQPFRLRARVGGRPRWHVPDFLLVHADGSVAVVDVKPAGKLTDPAVAEALGWAGRLVSGHGWTHEIWSGEDPVYLDNVRFLAGYRRPGLVGDEALDLVLASVSRAETVVSLVGRLSPELPGVDVRVGVLRLLWQRRLSTDLRRRLDGGSLLAAGR